MEEQTWLGSLLSSAKVSTETLGFGFDAVDVKTYSYFSPNALQLKQH